MKYCFTKSELESCFTYLFEGKCDDQNLISITENLKSFEDEVYILNFLVSQIIQKQLNHDVFQNSLIEDLYSLDSKYNIIIEEINDEFVEFILSHLSLTNSMEENVIAIRQHLSDYNYGSYIRN